MLIFPRFHTDDSKIPSAKARQKFTGNIVIPGARSLDISFSVKEGATQEHIASVAFTAVMNALLESGAAVSFDGPLSA